MEKHSSTQIDNAKSKSFFHVVCNTSLHRFPEFADAMCNPTPESSYKRCGYLAMLKSSCATNAMLNHYPDGRYMSWTLIHPTKSQACSLVMPLTLCVLSIPLCKASRVALASNRRFNAAAVRSCPRLPMPSSTHRILLIMKLRPS